MEKDKFPIQENLPIEKLAESASLKEADFCLDVMLESAYRRKGFGTFCNIENCVNILGNSEKDKCKEAFIQTITLNEKKFKDGERNIRE